MKKIHRNKSKQAQKNAEIRERTLLLCGASATGDEIMVQRMKIMLSKRPYIASIIKEFMASKNLQLEYEHSRCTECHKLVPKRELADHIQAHAKPKKKKRKTTKTRENKGPSVKSWKDLVQPKNKRNKAEARGKKKAIRISGVWVEVHSARASSLTSGDIECSGCKRKRTGNTKFWRYANTSEGPLVLCLKCKTKAINGGRKPKPKSPRKQGGDAMSRAVSGGGFDTNRRRH